MISRVFLPVGFATVLALAFLSSQPAAAGRAYASEDLTFREVLFQDDGTVRITFHARPETLWYCPGVNGKHTEQGLELTFVQAHFKKRPKVLYPAVPVPDSISKVVTIQTKGKPVFVRDGKKLTRLQAKVREK